MRIEFGSGQQLNVTYNKSNHTVSGLGYIVYKDFAFRHDLEMSTEVPASIAANQITYHRLMPQKDMYHFNGFIIHNNSRYPRMVMGTGGFYGDGQFIRYSIAPFILAPGASAHALLVERENFKKYDSNDFFKRPEYAYATKKILAQYKHLDNYNSREYCFEGLTLQVVTTPVFKRKCFCDDSWCLESDLGKVKESFSCGEGLLTTKPRTDSFDDYTISGDAHLPVVLQSDEETFKLPCITFGCTRDLAVSLGNDSSERSILVVSGGVTAEAVRYLGYPCCTSDGISDCSEGLYSNKDLLVLCIGDSSYAVVDANGVSYMTVSNDEKIPDAIWQNSIVVAIPLLDSKNTILDSMSVIGNYYNCVEKTYTKYVSRKELTQEICGEDNTLFTAGKCALCISSSVLWDFSFNGDLRSISVAERNWLGPTKKNANKWIHMYNYSSHLKLVYIFVQSRSKAMIDTYFMHPIVMGPHAYLQVHMAEPGVNCGYLYYRVWAVAMPLLMPVGVESDKLNDQAFTMRGASSIFSSMLHKVSPDDDTCACNNEDYIPVFYEDCKVFSKWSRCSSYKGEVFSLYSEDFAARGKASRYAVLPFCPSGDDFHNAFGFFVAPFGESLGHNYNKNIGNLKKFTNVTLRLDTPDIGAHHTLYLSEGDSGINSGLNGDYLNRKTQGVCSKMSIRLPIEHIVDPKTGNRSIFIVDNIEWKSTERQEVL